MNAIEITNLKKSFGAQEIIRDLTFSVPEHSVFGFLGKNGAGKTTTMKMILGLLKSDGGEIKVFDQIVSYGQTNTNKQIGYLPDVPAFYGYMNATEYLNLCGEITGLEKKTIKERSHEILNLVGLDEVHKKIGGFSRGMKQRLGIAQALLNEPRLLICDEPTSALDPIGRKEILDILERVKEKATVLFSTHILSDVERICNTIAVLNNGSLVMSGTIEEIKANHKTDSISLEFATKKELLKFLSVPQIAKSIQNSEISNRSVTLHCTDIKAEEQIILNALSNHGILPVKLELIDPSLESLFMEAVQ